MTKENEQEPEREPVDLEKVVEEKLAMAERYPGAKIEFTPDEAELAGFFDETAIPNDHLEDGDLETATAVFPDREQARVLGMRIVK